MSESSRAQVRSAMGRRKDQLVEIVTWLAFSNMLVVAGLEFMSGTSVLFRASLGLIPFGMLMPMVLLCNRSGRQLTARWLLMVTISLATLSQVVIFHGTDIRTYFYFGCVAVAAPVVLPWRHRAITFLFIGLNILGFVWMDSVQFHPSPGLMDLQGTWVVRALNAWARLALIVSIAMLIWGMEFLTRRTEMELDALATTDILTGLFNRRGGEKLLKRELALASRRHAALWLALVSSLCS